MMDFGIGAIADLGGKIIDKIFPNAEDAAKAKLELFKLEQEGKLEEIKTSMSAILAEANSTDPWTSRARPTFLYVFYVILLFMIMVGPVIGVFFPAQMDAFYTNVAKGFGAIPEELWWVFATGYLGYTGARTFEKRKGVK